jgi:conjugal transfer pilus assembly protein TraA
MQLNPAQQLAESLDQASTRLALWVMERKKAILMVAALLALLVLAVGIAHAGTTGTEFQGIYDKIKDWTSGYLGRSIAAFAFLLGLGAGVAKGSPIPAIAGVVFALFVAFGPAVLEGIATATV